MISVRQSSKILSLHSILASLSSNSLAEHLTTLRRDITTHYIDYVLTQPLSIAKTSSPDACGFPEEKAELFPAAPNSSVPISRIENLSVILAFLHTHLFPAIPESQRLSLSKLLSKPLTTGVLNHLLIPFLPSSLSLLPAYLELASRAVRFEEEDLSKLSDNFPGEKEIKAWTDDIVSHYEKKKRISILDHCRRMLMRDESGSTTFRAEVVPSSSTIAKKDDQCDRNSDNAAAEHPDSTIKVPEIVAEGINDIDEDSWGFEDEMDPTLETPSENVDEDAWGWNEEASPVENNNVDDADEPLWDAWDEPISVPDVKNPKPAKRLEKMSSKKKQRSDDHVAIPQASGAAHPGITIPGKPPEPQLVVAEEHPETVEYYLVSARMKELVSTIEKVLWDAEEIASSTLFSSSSSSTTPAGTLIFQTAPSILDLFRALYPMYPIVNSSDLSSSLKKPMQFSNDCFYLSEEVGRVNNVFTLERAVKDKLDDCRDTLKIFGQSWFETAIVSGRISFADSPRAQAIRSSRNSKSAKLIIF
jgi:protein transport protein DSL1/ZW10